MEAMIAAGGRGYVTAAAVNLVMSAREDPDDARRGARRDARGARRPAAGVGAARARAPPRDARLRARPDGRASARARPRNGDADVPVRRPRRPRRSSCCEQRLRERFPGLRIVGRLLAAVPAADAPRRTSDGRRDIDASGAAVVWVGTGPAQAGAVDAPRCARAWPRRCWSASARRSTSTPASSPRRRRGCSAAASSGPTGSRASRAACGGATRATTRMFVAGFARQYARHRRSRPPERALSAPRTALEAPGGRYSRR